MKSNDEPKFSWSGLFLVTSISFLLFSGIIRLINGSRPHSALFLKIGIVALIVSVFCYANSLNKPTEKKKRRRRTYTSSRRDIN